MDPKCDIEARRLGLYRDGEMEALEASRLTDHVATCPRCQAKLADLDAVEELLTERRGASTAELPADFAARVMSTLPAASSSVGWLERLRQSIAAHREAFAMSLLAVGVAIALLVVFAPGLRSQGDLSQENAENEAQIHQLDVSGAGDHAVVLQSAEGNTVIWVVPAGDADANSPSKSP